MDISITDFFNYIQQASSLTLYLASTNIKTIVKNEEDHSLLYKVYVKENNLIFEGYFSKLTPDENYTSKINALDEYTSKAHFWTYVPKSNNLNTHLDEIQLTLNFDKMYWLRELAVVNRIYDFYINPNEMVFKISFPLSGFTRKQTIGDKINDNIIGCTIEDTLHDKAPVGLQPTGSEGVYDS